MKDLIFCCTVLHKTTGDMRLAIKEQCLKRDSMINKQEKHSQAVALNIFHLSLFQIRIQYNLIGNQRYLFNHN